MSKEYNAPNWYWVVAKNASEVYSSKLGDYVGSDDADYVAWGEDGTLPKEIDSEANLGGVLYAYRLRPTPQGVLDGYLDTQAAHLETEPDYQFWVDYYGGATVTPVQARALIRSKLK